MNISDIKSNKDLFSFIKEAVSDISFGVNRQDEGEAILKELIKFVSVKAIGKQFRRIEEYRSKNYFISLLCAGDKGYYTHITKGGTSLIELYPYEDPEEALKEAFNFVDHFDETGEKLDPKIKKIKLKRKDPNLITER